MSPSCCTGCSDDPKDSQSYTECQTGDQSQSPPSSGQAGYGAAVSSTNSPPSNTGCQNSCCGSDSTEDSVQDKQTEERCYKCEELNPEGGVQCCDESCLVRIAVRDCEESCGPDSDSYVGKEEPSNAGCCSKEPKDEPPRKTNPCSRHLRSAENRFRPTLDALGCICRALLALSLESCCASNQRPQQGRYRARMKATRSRSSIAVVSTGNGSACCSPSGRTNLAGGCCKPVEESCCSKQKESKGKDVSGPIKGSCCGKEECEDGSAIILDVGRPSSCNSDRSYSKAPITAEHINAIEGILNGEEIHSSLELEKGAKGIEHTVLSIQGMTCTGCETKLQRTLAGMPGILNIQTSLVLSRAEFDLDRKHLSVEDAVAQLQRATGFECQIITKRSHEIEILSPGNNETLLKHPFSPGVTDIIFGGNGTIKIVYDPKVISARDIVESAFGIPLQLAPQTPDPSISAGSKHVRHVGLMTSFSICLTIPVLVLAWAPLPENKIVYGSISLALATIIQVFVAGPFYPAALKSLIFARVIEMDLLIVLSTSAAYIFSVIAFGMLVHGTLLSTGEFFETSSLLVTLIMLGRFVTSLARQKAIESISIRSLQQSTALLVDKDGLDAREIDARLLHYGDLFKVMPEARVVTDGTVISGISEVDESMVTGEANPVLKQPGSSIIAGSVNGSGTLTVRTTRLPSDNTISTIANMVDEAKLSKPKTQEIADRVAGYFVPTVAVLTIITFVVWVVVGIVVRNQGGREATVQAVTYAIAVLIISCPCAIGLAVPMVILIAGGVAADRGVIFRSADTIEIAKRATHAIFDKTGTLTQGRLTVKDEVYLGDVTESVSVLLGLVSGIRHPVSRAMAEHLESKGIAPAKVFDVKTVPGKGVQGTWNGFEVLGGNMTWLNASSFPQIQPLLSQGSTVFCLAIDGEIRAIFALQDIVRQEAFTVISRLRAQNIQVSIVSGDDRGAVEQVAKQLGIPPSNVISRASPADKQAYVQFIKRGNPCGAIIFIGDGTNDAVALTSADIGIHMNEGTDVARSAADVVLIRPDLSGVLVLLDLSHAAFRRIVFNFVWSFIYNLFAVLLATGAFVNARVPPAYAGVGEIVSVLPVIAVAVMLKWAKLGN